MFYIFHICNCISPQISINFRLCLAALEANNWTQKFREWSYLRDVFMFHFWMCFVKGIIQGVDRSFWFISWNVWSAWWHNIVVFVVFVFSTWNGFGKSWLNLQVLEHGQRVLVIGHAHSESHIIWIHHFHLSAVAGSWLKATSWEAKPLKYRI